ncbi:MAG: hypothetical protein ACYDAK_13390 [Candidatus Limnocylindrales bacterium]
MRTLLSTTLLAILLTLSFDLVTQAAAEPLSSSPDALVSELVVLKATTWAPRGMTDSNKACEIAKDLALARLGTTLSDLRVVERTGTTSFPSHLTCQWDAARDAYQALLSIELPAPFALGSLTADRRYEASTRRRLAGLAQE